MDEIALYYLLGFCGEDCPLHSQELADGMRDCEEDCSFYNENCEGICEKMVAIVEGMKK